MGGLVVNLGIAGGGERGGGVGDRLWPGNCAFPDLQVGQGRGHLPAALMPTSILGAQREWPERKPRRGEGHPHPLPRAQ